MVHHGRERGPLSGAGFAGRGEDRDLTVGARTLRDDTPSPGAGRRAAEGLGIFGRRREQILHAGRHRHPAATGLIDERRPEAVALGAPQILHHEAPGRCGHAGVERPVPDDPAHEAPEQRGDADRVVEARAAVGDP